MIDLSSIKPGDKVTVEAEVLCVNNGSSPPTLSLGLCAEYGRFRADKIISHTPAPREIKVGHRVLLGGKGSSLYGGAPYEVKHLDGHLAWIFVSLEHTLRKITMRILRLAEFLKLPAGTLFHKGEPWAFDGMAVKGESLERDWFERTLRSVECGGGSDDQNRRLDEMLESGASYPLESSYGRDGCFDDDALFLVYEPADLVEMAAIVAEAQRVTGGPVIDGEVVQPKRYLTGEPT